MGTINTIKQHRVWILWTDDQLNMVCHDCNAHDAHGAVLRITGKKTKWRHNVSLETFWSEGTIN